MCRCSIHVDRVSRREDRLGDGLQDAAGGVDLLVGVGIAEPSAAGVFPQGDLFLEEVASGLAVSGGGGWGVGGKAKVEAGGSGVELASKFVLIETED